MCIILMSEMAPIWKFKILLEIKISFCYNTFVSNFSTVLLFGVIICTIECPELKLETALVFLWVLFRNMLISFVILHVTFAICMHAR